MNRVILVKALIVQCLISQKDLRLKGKTFVSFGTKQQNLSFSQILDLGLSLLESGLNFCKQRLKYGCNNFFPHFKMGNGGQ